MEMRLCVSLWGVFVGRGISEVELHMDNQRDTQSMCVF